MILRPRAILLWYDSETTRLEVRAADGSARRAMNEKVGTGILGVPDLRRDSERSTYIQHSNLSKIRTDRLGVRRHHSFVRLYSII